LGEPTAEARASNNRPSGRRGFFYHWRVGGDVVNSTSFVLMYNPST